MKALTEAVQCRWVLIHMLWLWSAEISGSLELTGSALWQPTQPADAQNFRSRKHMLWLCTNMCWRCHRNLGCVGVTFELWGAVFLTCLPGLAQELQFVTKKRFKLCYAWRTQLSTLMHGCAQFMITPHKNLFSLGMQSIRPVMQKIKTYAHQEACFWCAWQVHLQFKFLIHNALKTSYYVLPPPSFHTHTDFFNLERETLVSNNQTICSSAQHLLPAFFGTYSTKVLLCK